MKCVIDPSKGHSAGQRSGSLSGQHFWGGGWNERFAQGCPSAADDYTGAWIQVLHLRAASPLIPANYLLVFLWILEPYQAAYKKVFFTGEGGEKSAWCFLHLLK